MFDVLSLVGGGLGGALRVVPEVMKLLNARGDQKHELAMTKLQLEIDKGRSDGQINVIHAQGEAADISGQQAIFLEAIKGQSQLSGVKWIDAVNSTVRPFLTYWIMSLFSVYKATVVYAAWNDFSSWEKFGNKIWTENDMVMLTTVLSFWFVDRVFRKNNENK